MEAQKHVAMLRTGLKNLLDSCFCDDVGQLPECSRCKEIRRLLEESDSPAHKLLAATLDEISNLVKKDQDGKKFPGLWRLHSEICQYLDTVES